MNRDCLPIEWIPTFLRGLFLVVLLPVMGWNNQPIDVCSGNMVDTFLELFGPNDPAIRMASNDQVYHYLSFMDVQLESGQNYYVRVTVSPTATTRKTGDYTIRIIGPGGQPVSNPSNSIIPLNVNAEPVQGHFESPSEEHWYIFIPAAHGIYTLVLNAPEGSMTPLQWKHFPVNYTIDRGPLGPLNSEKAIGFTKNNIEIWNDISTTSFRLQYGGTLDVDVQMSLFETFPALTELETFFYDPVRNSILLWGDSSENQTSLVWEWNSLAWHASPFDSAPESVTDAAYAYDENRKQTMRFGGVKNGQAVAETWIWDGTQWNFPSPTVSPSPRYGHAMAYDAQRHYTVLFGGIRSDGGILNDTWIFDGSSWSAIASPISPNARSHSAMFYDPTRQKVVLFGGKSSTDVFGDLWEWDGTTWSAIPSPTLPPAQYGSLVSLNRKSKQVFLVGGYASLSSNMRIADTWIWNGTEWNQATPSDSTLMNAPSLALSYHALHDQLILVSGKIADATYCETYRWNGSKWDSWGQGSLAYAHFRDELQARGINPLFFDNDGRMTDMIQGKGAGDVVRGFGTPVYKDRDTGEILGGHMFINGKLVTQDLKSKGYTGIDDDDKLSNLAQLIIHEFGHFCGLYHTQLYGYAHSNSYLPDERFMPIMWGIRPRPESSIILSGLKYDDLASLSDLYPDKSGAFSQSTGVIRGKAVFEDGSPVLGGIVIARSVEDRYGCAVTVDTDPRVSFGGEFTLPRVPPGEYEVWIEPMIYSVDGTWFHQTGFFALYPQDRAFQRPPSPQYYKSQNYRLQGASVLERVQVYAQRETQVEFVCNLLYPESDPVDARLRNSQFMAYGSPMISGHGDLLPDNRLPLMPFSFEISDEIEDVEVTVIPSEGQPLGIAIDFGMNTFFSSAANPEMVRTGEQGEFTVSFTREGENGFPLQNGIYFIEVNAQSELAAAYTLQVDSQSVSDTTDIPIWDLH